MLPRSEKGRCLGKLGARVHAALYPARRRRIVANRLHQSNPIALVRARESKVAKDAARMSKPRIYDVCVVCALAVYGLRRVR